MPAGDRRTPHRGNGSDLTPGGSAALLAAPTSTTGSSGRGGRHRHTSALSLAAGIALGAGLGLLSGLVLLAGFLRLYLTA